MGPIPHLWFFAWKTATLASELQVSMGPSPHLWLYAFTTASLWPKSIISMGPRPHLSFCACKTAWLAPENNVISIRITSLYGSQISPSFFAFISFIGSQTSPVDFWMQNSVLISRMTLVSWSQPSSVVLCIQNSDFSIRNTGPSPLLWILHAKQRLKDLNYKSLRVPDHTYGFFTFKTATLAPQLQVSMCSSPYLRVLHAKQGLLDQNYKSLCVPDFACWFLNAKQRA